MEFDPAKALREEIAGLVEVSTALKRRQRQLAQQHGELEVELSAISKLVGFSDAELARKREVLASL